MGWFYGWEQGCLVEASVRCALRVLDCKDLLQVLNSEEGLTGKAQLAGICPAMGGHLCLDAARNRGKLGCQYAGHCQEQPVSQKGRQLGRQHWTSLRACCSVWPEFREGGIWPGYPGLAQCWVPSCEARILMPGSQGEMSAQIQTRISPAFQGLLLLVSFSVRPCEHACVSLPLGEEGILAFIRVPKVPLIQKELRNTL